MIPIRKRTSLSIALLSLSASGLAQTLPSGAIPSSPRAQNPQPRWSGAISVHGGDTLSTGNMVINGDFETYSGGTCDTNLSNASFTAMMANATAFGLADEIDVIANPPCYGLPAVSGALKIAIHRQDPSFGGFSDAFSFDLSPAITAGNSYTLSFWAEADDSFSTALGSVQVGLSSSSTSLGTLVYTGALSTFNTWTQFTTTFVAPVNATYLTVNEDGLNAWSHIDAFSLVDAGIGTKYCTANANSTGFPADIAASGSASSSAGDLTLTSSPVPNQNSIFFHGTSPSQTPFGNGFLCTTGGLVQGSVVMGAGNVATYTYDNSDTKHSLAAFVGSTRNFQHWFRDPMGGGSLFNLSNAISIAIAP
jgi:hypothetical protein